MYLYIANRGFIQTRSEPISRWFSWLTGKLGKDYVLVRILYVTREGSFRIVPAVITKNNLGENTTLQYQKRNKRIRMKFKRKEVENLSIPENIEFSTNLLELNAKGKQILIKLYETKTIISCSIGVVREEINMVKKYLGL